MKAFKVLITVSMSVALFGGCAKKDNDFATRYSKNAMGATAKDPALAAAAVDAAKFSMDIVLLRTVSTSPMSFMASLLIDEKASDIRMTIGSPNTLVQLNGTAGSYAVNLQAMCPNADCNPLYVAATASLNSQPQLQIGYKFYRLEATSARDNYQLFPGTQVKSFESIVSYLNQNGDSPIQ